MENSEGFKNYLGIPRKEIPWYPSIDQELSSACGLCVSACKHGTYEFSKDKKVIVANPYCCEVFCESCKFQCPVEAISFPNRGEFKSVIKGLRAKYPPTD
jgi:NAD-dependent dihydropyrimidine dehydrogenase PreA subunit